MHTRLEGGDDVNAMARHPRRLELGAASGVCKGSRLCASSPPVAVAVVDLSYPHEHWLRVMPPTVTHRASCWDRRGEEGQEGPFFLLWGLAATCIYSCCWGSPMDTRLTHFAQSSGSLCARLGQVHPLPATNLRTRSCPRPDGRTSCQLISLSLPLSP